MQTIYSQSAIYLKLTLALNWVCTQLYSATPFEASPGCLPLLLPAHEDDIAVPSVQHHSWCFCMVWNQTKVAILWTAEWKTQLADPRSTLPHNYTPSQSFALKPKIYIYIYVLTNLYPHFLEQNVQGSEGKKAILLLFVLSFLRLCDLPHFLCVQTRTSLIQPTALCCCYV